MDLQTTGITIYYMAEAAYDAKDGMALLTTLEGRTYADAAGILSNGDNTGLTGNASVIHG